MRLHSAGTRNRFDLTHIKQCFLLQNRLPPAGRQISDCVCLIRVRLVRARKRHLHTHIHGAECSLVSWVSQCRKMVDTGVCRWRGQEEKSTRTYTLTYTHAHATSTHAGGRPQEYAEISGRRLHAYAENGSRGNTHV